MRIKNSNHLPKMISQVQWEPFSVLDIIISTCNYSFFSCFRILFVFPRSKIEAYFFDG